MVADCVGSVGLVVGVGLGVVGWLMFVGLFVNLSGRFDWLVGCLVAFSCGSFVWIDWVHGLVCSDVEHLCRYKAPSRCSLLCIGLCHILVICTSCQLIHGCFFLFGFFAS